MMWYFKQDFTVLHSTHSSTEGQMYRQMCGSGEAMYVHVSAWVPESVLCLYAQVKYALPNT